MNPFKNRRLVFFSLGLLLLGLVVFYLFTAKEKAPPAIAPVPTARPLPTTGITPTTQKLLIKWNNLAIQPPEKLSSFAITSPLIDNQAIALIAAGLGFRESDLQPTLKNTSRLFVRNNLTFFASTDQNQVLFNATGALPSQKGVGSPALLEQKAGNYLRQFFPWQTFVKTSSEYFYADNSSETYPAATTQSAANLVRFSYHQELNGYPLLTTSAKNAIISFTLDINQVLRSLEISGGYKTAEAGDEFDLLDVDALKIQAPRQAFLLSLETGVDVKSLIASQLSVSLDLDNLGLVYFAKPDSKQAVPAFLLSGTLRGGFPDTPALYLVPAFR